MGWVLPSFRSRPREVTTPVSSAPSLADQEPFARPGFPRPSRLLRLPLPPWSPRPRVATRSTVPVARATCHRSPHPEASLLATSRRTEGFPRSSQRPNARMPTSYTPTPFATHGFPLSQQGRPSAWGPSRFVFLGPARLRSRPSGFAVSSDTLPSATACCMAVSVVGRCDCSAHWDKTS